MELSESDVNNWQFRKKIEKEKEPGFFSKLFGCCSTKEKAPVQSKNAPPKPVKKPTKEMVKYEKKRPPNNISKVQVP